MSEVQQPHPRSIQDIERATYTKENPPQNANHHRGAMSNDLEDGRGGGEIEGLAGGFGTWPTGEK
jgi:hypothetical protein